jgi:hypothetical protein
MRQCTSRISPCLTWGAIVCQAKCMHRRVICRSFGAALAGSLCLLTPHAGNTILAQSPAIKRSSDHPSPVGFKFLAVQTSVGSPSPNARDTEHSGALAETPFQAQMISHQKQPIRSDHNADGMNSVPTATSGNEHHNQQLPRPEEHQAISAFERFKSLVPREPASNALRAARSVTPSSAYHGAKTRTISNQGTATLLPEPTPVTTSTIISQVDSLSVGKPSLSRLDIRPRSIENPDLLVPPPKDTSGLMAASGPPQIESLYNTDLGPANFCASASFYHRPLYFQDFYLERFGISRGLFGRIPPLRSGINFLGHTAALPLSMFHHPPHSYMSSGCIYR